MAWEIPKIDWTASDNPGPGDFNRIEKNMAFLLMQQPINIGAHSEGSAYRQTNQWLTLFTYIVTLLEGLSLPVKVFPGVPESTNYTGEFNVSGKFRVLVNGADVGVTGVEVSDDFIVTVQLYITSETGTSYGSWSSGPWVTNSYRY
jgi:hypothetical protein